MKKKDGKMLEYGAMHHVPGIFALNWIVLDQLMPDSAAQRKDVADALGMKGKDREYYLASGIPLADNNKCSEGQLQATEDLNRMHPRALFPDDHISIDRNFGDEREAKFIAEDCTDDTGLRASPVVVGLCRERLLLGTKEPVNVTTHESLAAVGALRPVLFPCFVPISLTVPKTKLFKLLLGELTVPVSILTHADDIVLPGIGGSVYQHIPPSAVDVLVSYATHISIQ